MLKDKCERLEKIEDALRKEIELKEKEKLDLETKLEELDKQLHTIARNQIQHLLEKVALVDFKMTLFEKESKRWGRMGPFIHILN